MGQRTMGVSGGPVSLGVLAVYGPPLDIQVPSHL